MSEGKVEKVGMGAWQPPEPEYHYQNCPLCFNSTGKFVFEWEQPLALERAEWGALPGECA